MYQFLTPMVNYVRNILPDMESNDLDNQLRNTQPDVEPIDIEYLLQDHQRVVNFLTAGTQGDKQRFIDLLNAKIDREWEARKAVSQVRRTPRRPDIYASVQDLDIDPSLIRSHYELPIGTVASSRKNKSCARRKSNSQLQSPLVVSVICRLANDGWIGTCESFTEMC